MWFHDDLIKNVLCPKVPQRLNIIASATLTDIT